MSQKVPSCLTVGEIARRLGCPLHRVEYLIRSRHIRPASRAGLLRVFSPEDMRRIASDLNRMDSKREACVP